MSTTHHPIQQNTPIHRQQHRPAQCLRHHVWMAACPDCREARVGRVSDAREQTAAAR